MPMTRKASSSSKRSKAETVQIEEVVLIETPPRSAPSSKSKRRPEKNESSRKSKRSKTSETSEIEEVVLIESPPRSTSSKRVVDENEKKSVDEDESRFIGEPVPEDEARQRWPHRYAGMKKEKGIAGSKSSKGKDDLEEIIKAKHHFTQAEIDGRIIFNLEDDAYVKAEVGEDNYIGRIVEMFEAVDGLLYFTAQWFYRAKDTVIRNHYSLIDDKRVFLSEVKDDNPLDCLVERLKILMLPLSMDLASRESAISKCDFYYDMMYLLPNFSFVNLPAAENIGVGSESDSTISSEANSAGAVGGVKFECEEVSQVQGIKNSETTLLDLYSGCGAMSTGLCLGANMAGVNLVTKWAVDLNEHACHSLKLNHPETEVRTESAEDFLTLLKEWQKLCISFSLIGSKDSQEHVDIISGLDDDSDNDEDVDIDDGEDGLEVFEVDKVLAICFGDPKEIKKPGLHLKIRWKGYGPDEDSWEPMEGLGDCQQKIKEFVENGYKSKILPLPGNVDVVCGGPPCQGISGFNRFRNKENPLEDLKNKQLVVFMDIVNFLRPRYVLMENVVDIVKFAGGFLGRYALGRLVGMNYQSRVGLMAAGAFGLPQFRMRVFIWGAGPTEKLPQYPLPTHNLVVRGNIPVEFESCTVAYEEGCKVELEKELLLWDAISDLPPVENDEARDEMSYGGEPETEFQRFIRLSKDGEELQKHALFDHRPLQLNEDDYQRVCQIPMKKGANFRDLRGVRVGDHNKVELDPNFERVYLPSGKPLVPDYALTFVRGISTKPFGRLWWDETVPTVVTRAEPHNQTILHPSQSRVLTIRENARLQGFPDYYKLLGPIKERYIQVGNAVAVPVARALGYALALAFQGSSGEEPLFSLPKKFPVLKEYDDYVVRGTGTRNQTRDGM
ncbi:DNA (cytosine-5)-methyltransferase CMT3-like [Cornus florida]|uniref:DNA (cytosine-5)-methyltransferase CMT3-like n=1 Tax=Cornus florida TaxID=4283 RepID=UPI002898001A|nr:DNA (cytosine-5)-methyltransferase CMT3-like [Cornus florida]